MKDWLVKHYDWFLATAFLILMPLAIVPIFFNQLWLDWIGILAFIGFWIAFAFGGWGYEMELKSRA